MQYLASFYFCFSILMKALCFMQHVLVAHPTNQEMHVLLPALQQRLILIWQLKYVMPHVQRQILRM